jgi:AraC-like DNA-binding protein
LRPLLEHLPLLPGESFVVKSFEYPYYPTPWHFHPEFEIVLVTESVGKRFIGDNIADFKPGDLAFIGPNLPHLYRNDYEYYTGENINLQAKSIVIHFLESSFGKDFLSLPEAKNIKELLSRSLLGIQVIGPTREVIIEKIHELCSLTGFSRWLKLLEILNSLSASADLKTISTQPIFGLNETESHRMNKIFEFIMNKNGADLSVKEVADYVGLSPNSFSRYFIRRTRKKFTTFVNEVRLSKAIKLLQENKLSVSEICFASGFNNLSNFNRQFRAVYNMNPLSYTNKFLNRIKYS